MRDGLTFRDPLSFQSGFLTWLFYLYYFWSRFFDWKVLYDKPFKVDREDAGLMQWLSSFTLDDLKGWDYEGWAENRPYEPSHPKYNPNNPNMPKHPETHYFLYYSKTINGKKYWANVKMHRDYNGEVLYTIEPKEPDDIIKGMP